MATREKAQLAILSRAAKGGLISVEAAAKALRVPGPVASARLARLARAGWTYRVRRGLYLILPLEAEPKKNATSDDPWVLARELFAPCYIGGWSAAEYWGLTEQLFRSTLVVTAAATRSTSATFLEHEFRLYRVNASRTTSGVVKVWRGAERVDVSGPERTLVDCLAAPELCGGVRHLAQILRAYGESERKNFNVLVEVAKKSASGAAWKRLGYMAEVIWPREPALSDAARKHMSTGLARLDPGVKRRGYLVTRWRLWVNASIEDQDHIAAP